MSPEPKSQEGQALYLHQRNGYCDLPCREEHPTFYAWAESKLNQFDVSYEEAKSTVCFINLAPYKSANFKNATLLENLPSCKAMIEWVHSSLVPEAERGDKVVVCMMTHNAWGFDRESLRGNALYSVPTNPGGFMFGPLRDPAIQAVRKAVGK